MRSSPSQLTLKEQSKPIFFANEITPAEQIRKHTRRVSGVVNPNGKKSSSMIQSLKVSLKPMP